ncbi:MAG: gamma-glutamyltransferase family protein [Cytophagales bacterium]|nr:MAG: hypothetical protein CNE34_04350 [Rhodothermaeota bacterium MED-G18]
MFSRSLFLSFYLLIISSCTYQDIKSPPQFGVGGNGVVSSAHPLASEAGIKILKKGGNAIDAAVASAFVLSVVEPSMSGIGGRLQAIIKLPNGEVRGVDASTQVPENYDAETHPKNSYGYSTIGIPGVVAGLVKLNKEYGKLSLKEVMEDAIYHAENGYHILPGESFRQKFAKDIIKDFSGTKKYFLKKDGENYNPGELMIQKDLAEILKHISDRGRDGFYKGEIANKIVEDIQSNGGILSLDDLENYEAKDSKVLEGSYRGFDIYSLYLPSYGAITLEILNILSYFNIKELTDSEWVKLFSDIIEVAYLDRPKQKYKDSLEIILSKEHALQLSKSLKKSKLTYTLPNEINGEWVADLGHTTHLSASDIEGNVISLTQTVGPLMGSKVVTDGLGFLYAVTLGGYLGDYRPGDRANSHISPTIVTKENGFYLALGAAGGSRIITAITQVISNVIDKKMRLDRALSNGRVFNMNDTTQVEYHEGLVWDFSKENLPGKYNFLESKARFGRVHAVQFDTLNNIIIGSADPDWEGSVDTF